MNLGFIGLGIMGRPMARHLLAAGHGMTVWNRSRPGIEAMVAAGARGADSARGGGRQRDVVFTMVGDSPDVEQVALGSAGIKEGARSGLVHIDMSTISPSVTRAIAAAHGQ